MKPRSHRPLAALFVSLFVSLFAALLLATLPPSPAARAAEYRVELTGGRTLTGEIVEETDSTLTLQLSNRLRRVVPRADIIRMTEIVTPTPIPAATATPTPDIAAELERAAYRWSVSLLTTDFGTVREMSTAEFQQRYTYRAFTSFARETLGDSKIVKPIDLRVEVNGDRGVARQGVPTAQEHFTDPDAWPWTSRWVREGGEWRQAPDIGGALLAVLEAHEARVSSVPTPTPSHTPGPSPTERISRDINVEVREYGPPPTPMPTAAPEEVEPVFLEDDADTEEEVAFANFPDWQGMWRGLLPEQQMSIALLLFTHVLFSLWVLIDARRRVGRPLATALGIFLGGLLTGCMPVAWLAYFLIRGRL